ncbi:MAG: zinc ABC transporter substrate-binding protein [Planctomycetota bacterium]|nr:zinc ABC transporter substrate-binding protein [Planctomycetota bacterium]
MRIAALVLTSLVIALQAGCAGEGGDEGPDRLAVAVSIAPQAWLVEQIAGDAATITTLVRSGESPATYQPSDAQISELMKASVYFRIGVPFENGPWFEAIRASERVEVVDTRRGITLREVDAHRHHHDEAAHEENASGTGGHTHGLDPHIWLSPPLLKLQARTIAEALKTRDPARAAVFENRWTRLEQRLDELDEAIRRTLTPVRGRSFLIFHPAWGYFADEYGLKQVAIEIEGKTPTDHELTALQQFARNERIDVVFVQPQISGQAAEAVAAAIDGRIEALDPLAAEVEANLLRVADVLAEALR